MNMNMSPSMSKLSLSIAITIVSLVTGIRAQIMGGAPWTLRDLPYAYHALEPTISKKTLETHHLKHQKKYLDTANKLVLQNETAKGMTDIKTIIKEIQDVPIFNNVAQFWNHDFYWQCMSNGRTAGGKPDPLSLVEVAINDSFGSFETFLNEMKTAALTTVGSGWAWLGWDRSKGKLVVTKTSGAGNPMVYGVEPLLTIDVWEHAYYLDYKSKRENYVDAFFDKLVNWQFVEKTLMKAPGAYEHYEDLWLTLLRM